MRTVVNFTKMEGLGNDYIYVNGFAETVDQPELLARAVSDRHFGVGSDGLVMILPPESGGDVRMRMFNSDGSEAEMCGNASRCVGKYAFERGLVAKEVIRLETRAGIKVLHLDVQQGQVASVRVDMGEPEPIPSPADVPEGCASHWCVGYPVTVVGCVWHMTTVSMGNPHCVVFVDDVQALDLPVLGPQFEHHPLFPQRVNTEFVQVISDSRLKMRVWERGAGETLACGTGACASAVAAVLNGKTGHSVELELLGGVLYIEWNAEDNHVYMTGPARMICDGRYFFDTEWSARSDYDPQQ